MDQSWVPDLHIGLFGELFQDVFPYPIGIRVSNHDIGLLMNKLIFLGVGPVKILFLIMDQSAKMLRNLTSVRSGVPWI